MVFPVRLKAKAKVQRIRSILESIFEWSGLGCYKALGESYPDRIFSFLNNTKSEAQALIIQLWRKDSRIAFYKDSHLYPLDGRPAANGFLEIPPPNLAIETIERIEVDMKEGGLYDSLKTLFVFVLTRYRAVIDARLGFTVIEGIVINFGFATKEELKEWATMKLPNLPEFKTRIISMTRENIGNNFELIT